MKFKKQNIFAGLLLIYFGIDFLVNPVRYNYRVAYDLRGWTKWIAAFFSLLPGIYLLATSSYKGKLKTYYCAQCGKTEKLVAAKEYVCPFCKLPLKHLEPLKDE